ncbi:TPA: hypothetical protein R5723_000987 [Campylobacter jejuni]|uniref:hypothetical protein n=1 Tax=Campylobacter jejuni TaxID=197 RepID=UPI000D57DA4A|nr:hypothetical protein [Campylobacter jejuni]ECP8550746.1 hypothetical protein [Campylobacter jejuni]ECP8670886.1 hypothetical protein [Campylobacter jejuni]ECP8718628.1 hypothetical protein [Campylobacter jejuni]ECP8881227.1 hypothetical protein [Campylobacter jejuni]ECP9440912.1 hypothetical protein [Campylobacter jejuni]
MQTLIQKTIFLNTEVAISYKTSKQNINSTKNYHADELIENIHYFYDYEQTKGGRQRVIKWTLEGVYMLGFFIKSPKAKEYRKKVAKLLREQTQARFKTLSDENQRLNSLNHHQKIGYKSQLEQQKTNFNNQIKALKYDLIQTKEELDACKGALEVLKRRKDFGNEENLRLLQKELAKYGLVIFNELDFTLWSENLTKNIIGETKRRLDDLTRHNYELLKEKFDKRISYFKDKK